MKYLVPYFLDASVIVKLLVEEKGSDRVRRLWQTGSAFMTTWLCVAETYGVLKRKFESDEITRQQYVSKIYHLLALLEPPGLTVITEFGNEKQMLGRAEVLIEQYGDYGKKHRIDFSDALQIASLQTGILKELQGGRSRPLFVTADYGTAEAVKAQGITVWNPLETECPPPEMEISK